MQIRKRTLATAVALSTVAVSGAAGWGAASAAPAHHASSAGRTTLLAAYHGAGHAVGAPTGAVGLTVSLAMRNNAGYNRLMAALYNPHSPRYHHWLTSAEFDARFAPTAAQRHAVAGYLRGAGLTTQAHGPFLIGVRGSAADIGSAFHTTLTTIRNGGTSFTTNTTPASVPSSLASSVQGLIGLRSLRPSHSAYKFAQSPNGTRPKYGAGPYHSGLSPSQQVSLNGGNKLAAKGKKGQGAGETLGLFELSGYTPSDIVTWWKQFYGSRKMPKITDVNVDGGPVSPQCPAGDQCGPFDFSGPQPVGLDSADYSGDVEVEADIEELLAMAPGAKQIDVYNAPNDFNGQTELDEYAKIAKDNAVSVVSSSWGLCETDAQGDPSTPDMTYPDAEETSFKEMAAQGQSSFNDTGDTGSYDCLRGSGQGIDQVEDPGSDPYTTAVGGTSYQSWDPNTAKHPAPPADQSSVWNDLGLCFPGQNTTSGFCSEFGAGGGGDSAEWAAPAWESKLKGFQNSQSSDKCSSSPKGGLGTSLCREVPDVSADADPETGDSEYCSGSGANVGGQTNPPGYPGDSTCAAFVGSAPAWFGIGGTSLSTPLWAGVVGLIDGAHGSRLGLTSEAVFKLAEKVKKTAPFLHDMTGKHLVENSNGTYKTRVGYDQATGLGTPIIDTLVTVLK